jgi:hypothetical protein
VSSADDSGKNSASAIAPADVSPVLDKKSCLSAVFSVNAVRNDWICSERESE